MGYTDNLCEKCLNFMKVEKIEEDLILKCPYCEELEDIKQ